MAFFNVHIKVTEDYVLVQEGPDAATAEQSAKDRLAADPKAATRYGRVVLARSQPVNPDSI